MLAPKWKWTRSWPTRDFFVLVCGVVVEDDVDFEIGIDAAFDGLDELKDGGAGGHG